MNDATRKLLEQLDQHSRLIDRHTLIDQHRIPESLARRLEEMDRISVLAGNTISAMQIAELTRPLRQLDSILEVSRERARELAVFQRAVLNTESINRLIGDTETFRFNVSSGAQAALASLGDIQHRPLINEETQRALQVASDAFRDRFRLPELGEFAKLQEHFASLSSSMTSFGLKMVEIQAAMDAVTSPWVDKLRALESFREFTGLTAIGKAIRSLPFESSTIRTLHSSLGNWDSLPDVLLDDSLKREDFYLDHGLDAGLIAIPEPAFTASLQATHIVSMELLVPDADTVEFDSEQEDFAFEEESLFLRIQRTCSLVLRFETALRQFLHRIMTERFGTGWEKSRTPGNGKMFEEWTLKRDRAIKNTEQPLDLVHYADFTDYSPLITKRDNWKEVFSTLFRDEEDIRVSFKRIEPLRVIAMHARPITKGDLLTLGTETTRILTAIGVLKK